MYCNKFCPLSAEDFLASSNTVKARNLEERKNLSLYCEMIVNDLEIP
jgi:hypothetical protein